jgi:hypothetical protein
VQTIYTHRGEARVHEPHPLRPRPREPVLPARVKPKTTTGKLILADVYQGRHMKGVRRGDIRKLLVLELLPKPVNFSGGPDLLTWRGTFTLQRVLGTVPVEKDGSAFFEVPANRSVFFVSLDENNLSVKRMQSFASVMPGEVTGCVGCHEYRTELPSPVQTGTLAALRRPASKIRPFEGFPDVLDYHRDIQPILDRHCVPCHGPEKREGKLVLTGDLGPRFSHGYVSLLATKLVADGRNGYGNQPPRTIGSSASPLLRMLDGTHYEARLSERERRTIWLWIESGAAYAGSYAALRNNKEMNLGHLSGGIVFGEQKDVFRRRCAKCHPLGKTEVRNGIPSLPFNPSFKNNNRGLKRPVAVYERVIIDNDPIARFSSHILLNLSRPEFSALLLGPLDAKAGGYGSCGPGQVFKSRNDPDYKKLLASLRKSKAVYKDEPRYATPGFRPNRQYLREMKKYGVLPASFDPARDQIDIFETEQKYWKSLWNYGSPGNPAQADQK